MRHRRRRKVMAWLFVAPLLILNSIVMLGPSLGSGYFAFTEWSGIGPATWVGLDNFKRMLLEDRVFRIALGNNVRWMLLFLVLPTSMGLVGSALLGQVKRLRIFFRIVYFLPGLISSVVIVHVWRSILDPTRGIGPWLAVRYGIELLNRSWFGDPDTVFYAISFIANWGAWGFNVVLYLGAMQAISPELYEAGLLDGANRWQEWRYITLPGIMPTVVFTGLMTIVGSFQVFNYVYMLTGGGPAHASEVLATAIQRSAFRRFEVGYASTIGLSMAIFSGLMTTVFNQLRRRGLEI